MFGKAIPCLKHFQNIVFGTVLPSMGLLWSADNHLSNSDSSTLRAMTSSDKESAVMVFVVFSQLLKLCGAIHNFDHRSTFSLRRIGLSLFQQQSDCAAGGLVNYFFYNTITPTVY